MVRQVRFARLLNAGQGSPAELSGVRHLDFERANNRPAAPRC